MRQRQHSSYDASEIATRVSINDPHDFLGRDARKRNEGTIVILRRGILDDIESFLEGETVVGRLSGFGYRLQYLRVIDAHKRTHFRGIKFPDASFATLCGPFLNKSRCQIGMSE